MTQEHLSRRARAWHAVRALFIPLYVLLNAIGVQLDRGERRIAGTRLTLPMNLLLSARRPTTG
jgi:hypothetical protein